MDVTRQINWVLIGCVVRPTFDIYLVDLAFKTTVALIVLQFFFLGLPRQSINVEVDDIETSLDQKKSILGIYEETFS